MPTATFGNFNLCEIRQVQTGNVNPSRYVVLARQIDRLANRVNKAWDDFSPEQQTALKDLAYWLTQTPQGLNEWWLKLWISFRLLLVRIQGQQRALELCCAAIDKLIDNIFDQIERSDRVYQQHLADTLDEIKNNPNLGESLRSGEVRDWLRGISDQALDEV